MKTLSIVAAAILMTATGALAEEPQAERPAEREKKICRSQKMTGSLTRVRRTCLTQAEWARLAEGSRDAVNEIIDDADRTRPSTSSVTGAF